MLKVLDTNGTSGHGMLGCLSKASFRRKESNSLEPLFSCISVRKLLSVGAVEFASFMAAFVCESEQNLVLLLQSNLKDLLVSAFSQMPH